MRSKCYNLLSPRKRLITPGTQAVKSRDVVYDVVVRFFVVVVQEVSAAGVSSCSVGVSLILRDLLRTSRPR